MTSENTPNISSTLYQSALALSHIRHRRFSPVPHSFDYQIGYLWLNLDDLDEIAQQSSLWSLRSRFSLISLLARDYLGGQEIHGAQFTGHAIKQAVFDCLNFKLSVNVDSLSNAKVMLLTLPRFMGFSMNPVSFYFVFMSGESLPSYIVAEITNTPWEERFAYAFACDQQDHREQFVFDKAFHVSPFMPMELQYDWRFSITLEKKLPRISIYMGLHNLPATKEDRFDGENHTCEKDGSQKGAKRFDATMDMVLKPLTQRMIRQYPFRYPFQSLKVAWGIYYHALKLKLKGNPFYAHPRKR